MIYFIQCGKKGPVKIGMTRTTISDRLAQFRVHNPYPLYVIRRIKMDNYITEEMAETFLHYHFSERKIRGEWFKFSPSMMSIKVPQNRATLFSEICRYREIFAEKKSSTRIRRSNAHY